MRSFVLLAFVVVSAGCLGVVSSPIPGAEVPAVSGPGSPAAGSGGATDAGSAPVVPVVDAGAPVVVDAGSPVVVDAGVPEVDDAEVVSLSFPASLLVGATATGTVTVRNTGTSTWTKAAALRLGAVDDTDPLASTTRYELGAADVVAPGEQHTFTVPLTAPSAAGTVLSDWRMLREGVRWFGATATAQVAVTAPPVVTPNGDDMIDLTGVQVFNSPADVASWPITTHITQLTMTSPDVGLSFEFPAKATWPDYTPPGWDGPLQYTVWAVVNVGGTWSMSGYIQMWNGRPSTGAPILSDFAANWAYDSRWGPMMGHQPVAGELMGFFVTAGDARNQGAVTSLRERSNVVVVALPAGDNGTFTF